MYELKYLPLALKDLREITSYIAETIKVPEAALNLLDALDKSISRHKQFPFSCRVYQLNEPVETEYRMLFVKNYMVFYVVIEHIIEIHRIIYAKMSYNKIVP